jgi:hypothetical protein
MTARRMAIAIGTVLAASCIDGHASVADTDSAAQCTPAICGGPKWTAVVSNAALDAECEYQRATALSLPVGKFDVATSAGDKRGCEHAYVAHLVFSSNVQSYQTEIISFYGGFEVSLLSPDGETIAFGPGLPNPFTTPPVMVPWETPARGAPSLGFADVTLIPATYRDGLKRFAGGQVIASFSMPTANAKHEPSDQNFSYPIDICDGCMTACASRQPAAMTKSKTCQDNAGADGRICIDPDC